MKANQHEIFEISHRRLFHSPQGHHVLQPQVGPLGRGARGEVRCSAGNRNPHRNGISERLHLQLEVVPDDAFHAVDGRQRCSAFIRFLLGLAGLYTYTDGYGIRVHCLFFCPNCFDCLVRG